MQHCIASAAAIVVGLAWDKAFESLTAPSLCRDAWGAAGCKAQATLAVVRFHEVTLNMVNATWNAVAPGGHVPCIHSICHACCLVSFVSLAVLFSRT